MKALYPLIYFTFCCFLNVNSQNLQPDMQRLKTICLNLRASIEVGDIDGLRNANKEFKKVKTTKFNDFRLKNRTKEQSLNGHFIFEPHFVDDLVKKGKGIVYRYADRYATRRSNVRELNGILVKNILLSPKSASIYQLVGNNHMELVFITEPKGLISVTLLDTKHKVYYKEKKKERAGDICRVHIFDLPPDGNALIEVTIRNQSNSEVSCVILSNQ